jgi:plastocyanin
MMNFKEKTKNNNYLDLLQVLIVISLIFSIFLSIQNKPKVHVVEMTSHRFVPSLVKIKKGDSIKFINKSNNLHNVVVKKLKISTKMIKKNEVLIIKPENSGRFDFYCQPHKSMGMIGEIVIE